VQGETRQTVRAVISLICRVVLLGIAVPLLLGDFPDYKLPYRFPTAWTVVTVCDALAVFAPLLRARKLAFLAGAAVLGAHYYFQKSVPVWGMAYLAVAIVFVALPSSGRGDGKKKRPQNAVNAGSR
jgi:hypothetical protein